MSTKGNNKRKSEDDHETGKCLCYQDFFGCVTIVGVATVSITRCNSVSRIRISYEFAIVSYIW